MNGAPTSAEEKDKGFVSEPPPPFQLDRVIDDDRQHSKRHNKKNDEAMYICIRVDQSFPSRWAIFTAIRSHKAPGIAEVLHLRSSMPHRTIDFKKCKLS